MRLFLVAVLSGVVFAVCALPASAAFPGAPGRVAFLQGDTGGVTPYGIATAAADGTDQKLVGPTCQEGLPLPCPANAAWSRDGTKLAFDIGGAIGTMDADGSDAKTFTLPGLTELSRPAWDPTGGSLVVEALDASGERNLFIASADGVPQRQLTWAGGSQAAWSLDERITFVRNRNIYVIDADGTNLRRITGKGGAQPTWSPYASQIAFVRAGNVYRVRQDASGLRRLTGKGGYEPAWAPDGKRVLFHRNTAGNRRIYSVNLEAADLLLLTDGEEGRIVNVFSVDQQPVR